MALPGSGIQGSLTLNWQVSVGCRALAGPWGAITLSGCRGTQPDGGGGGGGAPRGYVLAESQVSSLSVPDNAVVAGGTVPCPPHLPPTGLLGWCHGPLPFVRCHLARLQLVW